MPLYKWVCKCGTRARTLSDDQNPEALQCQNCFQAMSRDTGGSTSVMEVLDNGIMARKVERYRDIEDLRHDHGTLTQKKDGDTI